eukprot:gnl/TRDRNA2_/TRDRNA2_74554_c0_seq1.p1 gnl/TRDRNA2_/TRDRNA2_74554_c0~~gnl/TRDRNA2_/TRDRNA2_74554_c0_seq1.p1  ORF type:complete len:101 (+),score=3.71 gnl/TRDRNA2_/TRDRNA2_74554_c0_seq1:3-305(+)
MFTAGRRKLLWHWRATPFAGSVPDRAPEGRLQHSIARSNESESLRFETLWRCRTRKCSQRFAGRNLTVSIARNPASVHFHRNRKAHRHLHRLRHRHEVVL